jgi:hypothetical protein
MMVTPFTSPIRVKRRPTPPKPARAWRISSSDIPRCSATATAASALEMLWLPGMGNVRLSIFRLSPRHSIATSKCALPFSNLALNRPDIRAFALKPNVTTGRSTTRRPAPRPQGDRCTAPRAHRTGTDCTKAPEALAQGVQRAPMVQMLGVDIGDDGHMRRHQVEGAVAFIGLDHHPFARPGPRVRPVGMDHPPLTTVASKPPGHPASPPPSSSSWSCHACRPPKPCGAGASVRPASRPGARRAGPVGAPRPVRGCVGLDRGGHDDNRRPRHIPRRMAREHPRAQRGQPFGDRRCPWRPSPAPKAPRSAGFRRCRTCRCRRCR